jgi:TolB-like protein/DNA-binding SARP family transcriptional activator
MGGGERDTPSSANHDKAVSRGGDKRPVVTPANTPTPNVQETGPAQHGDKGWRSWWRRFYGEFSDALPEKQIAQIYYITAILAVTGSLIAGIWAFGQGYFFKNSAMETEHSAKEPVITAANQGSAALSLVVMPFVNLSGDASQDYFADGITDSLTTDLSHALPGSFVVARETAFTYKGKAVDARQIGRDLGVRYVLEGSTVLNGDHVRVNARLADAQLGNEVWAEHFDTARGDLLQVQDEIVGRLSRAIGLEVINFAARRSQRERPNSTDAIDLVLRGEAALNRPSSAANMIEARSFFQQALKLQSDNVDALAGVATTYVFDVLNGYYSSGNEQRLQLAKPLLDRALALDDRHLVALKARAALLRAQGHFDGAITVAQAVVTENPGEPWAYKEVGLSTMYLGHSAAALDWFDKAERFGPRDPGRWTWLAGKGQTLVLLGRDDDAIAALRAAIDANPAAVREYAVLAAALALSGRTDEARAALDQYSRVSPGMTVATFRNLSPVPLSLTDPAYRQQRERLKEGLRKAGMPD